MKVPAQLTAVFELTSSGWYVASIEEMPGVVTQGKTLDEARENLQDALMLMIEVRREDALAAQSANAVRENIEFIAA